MHRYDNTAPFNVAQLLEQRAQGESAEQVALVAGALRLSFRELNAESTRLAAGLARLGLRPAERVLLHLDESAAYVVSFWAVLRLGAVAIPASPRLSAEELAGILTESRATLVLVDTTLWPRIRSQLVPGREHPCQVVLCGDSVEGLPTVASLSRASLSAEAPAAGGLGKQAGKQIIPRQADDPACWLYTSGTTGRPKAAVHTHRNLAECATRYARNVLGIGPADRLFSAARAHFAYGLGNTVLFPVGSGCAAVIHPGVPDGPSLLSTIARHCPTILLAGPSHLQAMLTAATTVLAHTANIPIPAPPPAPPGAESIPSQMNTAGLRLVVSAGEPLPAELYAAWRRVFEVEVLDAVGSTENLTFYLSNRPGQSIPGCSGVAITGFDLRLVDDNGGVLTTVGTGLLQVRGPTTAIGYWDGQVQRPRPLPGTWLATGDRFRRDAKECYWFLGRHDDRFKVNGAWVAPLEVEQALATHPAVERCVVVPRRDENGLGQAVAYVVPAANTAARSDEGGGSKGRLCDQCHLELGNLELGNLDRRDLSAALRGYLAARLPAHKVPAEICFRSDLPRTLTGKIRRQDLLDAETQLRPAAAVSAPSERTAGPGPTE